MERVLHCANCGGQLSPEVGARRIRCNYCDAITVVEDEPAPAPPPPPEQRREPAPRSRVRFDSKLASRIAIGAAIAAALGWLAYTYFHTTRTWGGTPVIADVDGDGVEDIVGHWQQTSRDHTHEVVGLIDGASHRVQWTYELPQNKWAQDRDLALADGGALAVAIGKPQLVVLDARTGKLRTTIDLPELAQFLFAHGHEVRVMLHEGKPVTVDLAADSVESGAPEPAWAPWDAYADCPAATCASSMDLADMVHVVDHFEPGSDDSIATGRKQTGTHLGMLVGRSRSTGQIRWTRTLSNPDGRAGEPSHLVVSHGRAYFSYSVDSSPRVQHVAAISLLTGELVWDVDVSSRDVYRIVAGTRVYVTTRDTLRVLDAQTGATITTYW